MTMTRPNAIRRWAAAATLLIGVSLPALAHAELNPKNVSVARLDNGLTVLVLEDHAQPVVSVQMLYKAGARDESNGKTGLAHFMEHMAFRASKHFPDNAVADAIYDVGGEWHAYTWLDQTTYFETAPKTDLPLLLRVEADRMHNLLIPAKEVNAERGAVLTEMHGYQNDPASVLHDNTLYTLFQAHPYRDNTIGWESDVDSITRADLEALLQDALSAAQRGAGRGRRREDRRCDRARHRPASAPFPAACARRRRTPSSRNRSACGASGLLGPVQQKYFEIAYRAPSVRSPDYAAFLILQDILGASSGVNFQQNDWGTPVRKDALSGRHRRQCHDLVSALGAALRLHHCRNGRAERRQAPIEDAVEQGDRAGADAPISPSCCHRRGRTCCASWPSTSRPPKTRPISSPFSKASMRWTYCKTCRPWWTR